MDQPYVSGLVAPFSFQEGWQGHGANPLPVASTSQVSDSDEVVKPTVEKRKHACTFPGCEKSFTTSGHLARHARTHTGEKRFQCTFPGCQSRFSRHDNMLQHYRSHLSRNSRRRKTAPARTQGMVDVHAGSSSSSRSRSVARSPAVLGSSGTSVSPLAMPEGSLEAVSPLYSHMPLPNMDRRLPPQPIDLRQPYPRIQPVYQPGINTIPGQEAFYVPPERCLAAHDRVSYNASHIETTPERFLGHRHSFSAFPSNMADPVTPTSAYSGFSADDYDSEGYFLEHTSSETYQPHNLSPLGAASSHSGYVASSSASSEAAGFAPQMMPSGATGGYLYGTLQQPSAQPSFAVPMMAQARHVGWQPDLSPLQVQAPSQRGSLELHTFNEYVPIHRHNEPNNGLGLATYTRGHNRSGSNATIVPEQPAHLAAVSVPQLVPGPTGSAYISHEHRMHSAPIAMRTITQTHRSSIDSQFSGPSSAPAFTSTFFHDADL